MTTTKERSRVLAMGLLTASVAAGFLIAQRATGQQYGHEKDQAALLKALPKSKQTLADGIRLGAAKAPETAISAKFEFDDKGKLSLSVYTAEKGLTTDAEHNVLKEMSGNPEGEKWAPETEVFKDVEHVSRSAQQLTLMMLSPLSLQDIIQKAEKQQPGKVLSIAPMVRDRKPLFVVQVAAQDKVVELTYDLMTGQSR